MSIEATRTQAYDTALLVVIGCQTREQLENARNYVRRFCETYGKVPECRELWKAVDETDRRLFPLDYDEVVQGG